MGKVVTLVASAAMIEGATQIVKALGRNAARNPIVPAGSPTADATDCDAPVRDDAVGGSAWEGICLRCRHRASEWVRSRKRVHHLSF